MAAFTTPLVFEVIRRSVFHVTDHAQAARIREALKTRDIELLAELIADLDGASGHALTKDVTTDVLDCREVSR